MDNQELLFHIRSLSRIIFFITDEEDRFLVKFRDAVKKYAPRTKVYNSSFGLVPIADLIKDWTTREHKVNDSCASINDALITAYKDDPEDEQSDRSRNDDENL